MVANGDMGVDIATDETVVNVDVVNSLEPGDDAGRTEGCGLGPVDNKRICPKMENEASAVSKLEGASARTL